MSSITTQHIDDLIDVFTESHKNKTICGGVTTQFLNELDSSTAGNYELNTNIGTRYKILDAAITHESRLNNMGNNQTYSFEVQQSECEPVSNQNKTGTCWLYATLNLLRKPFMAKYNLKTFEFSTQYLFFWHKYELSNFWLESIISTVDVPLNSRLIQYLLHKGCEDGSQFDSALNLIEKYGLMPAICNNNELFAEKNEVKVKKRSFELNKILNRKLREYALILRTKYQQNKEKNENILFELRRIKKCQMNEIYRILVISFGKIIKTFNWKYNDNKNNFHSIDNISPFDFYTKYVKPCYNINNLVSLINDPRNEYYKLFTVDHYGNVINGKRKKIKYINVPMDILKKYTIKMLKDNKACWFACDVRLYYYEKFGSLDETQFDFNKLFALDDNNSKEFINMDKKDNLEYGASCNSHSMVIVGFDEKDGGKNKAIDDEKTCIEEDDICINIKRWKVENSWGKKRGNKGYVMMTDEWFDKFAYQVLVEKNILTKDILNVLQTEPISLPRWDPFAQ